VVEGRTVQEDQRRPAVVTSGPVPDRVRADQVVSSYELTFVSAEFGPT
jgi:hypothetical protein